MRVSRAAMALIACALTTCQPPGPPPVVTAAPPVEPPPPPPPPRIVSLWSDSAFARDTAPVVVPELPPSLPETILTIALGRDRPDLEIRGSEGMLLTEADGLPFAILPGSDPLQVQAGTQQLRFEHAGLPATLRSTLHVAPLGHGVLSVDGREYRGELTLRRDTRGILVLNRVSIEGYLIGVVSAEMGPRPASEIEALKAQAVTARTYALRNRTRWASQGFDLLADVNDQVYQGLSGEHPEAAEAVAATRGEVLLYGDDLIDAFYYSTCGGKTEQGDAVFAGAARPYLRSVPDLDPAGVPWCIISPRFTWTESWTREGLIAILSRTLPSLGISTTPLATLTDIRITGRTPSGRVASLELVGRSSRVTLSGQTIRRALAPQGTGMLRATDFTVTLGRGGGQLTRIDLRGRGNGHGVGLCQWGAIGRARAGQDYQTILSSYFPGTSLGEAPATGHDHEH